MQDEIRDCGCNNNCGCGNNGNNSNNGNSVLSNLFGGCGCSGDTEILLFIIVFLLLFTSFGCGCGRN
jgi:hypothetical protein